MTRDTGVSISSKGNQGRVDPRTIERRAIRILEAAERPDAKLSLLLCDDPFIQNLNRDYRGKDAPTDVLSFSMTEGEPAGFDTELLGDVVVSIDTAKRQAEDAKRPLTDEITSLVIHGVLHLLGHDHNTQKAEKRMFSEAFRIEAQVLQKAPRGTAR